METEFNNKIKGVLALIVVAGSVVASLVAMFYNLPLPTLLSTGFGVVVGFFFRDTVKI